MPPEWLVFAALREPVVGRYLLHVSVSEEMQLAGLEAVLTFALVEDVGLKLGARTRCLLPRHVAPPAATSSSGASYKQLLTNSRLTPTDGQDLAASHLSNTGLPVGRGRRDAPSTSGGTTSGPGLENKTSV